MHDFYAVSDKNPAQCSNFKNSQYLQFFFIIYSISHRDKYLYGSISKKKQAEVDRSPANFSKNEKILYKFINFVNFSFFFSFHFHDSDFLQKIAPKLHVLFLKLNAE